MTIATTPGSPTFVARLAMMIEVNTAIAPTERSMPGGQDDQRLTERERGDDGDLAEHQPEVGRGQEPAVDAARTR